MRILLSHTVLIVQCLLVAFIAACPSATPAPAPPIPWDATDAAFLLDAGPNPTPCALACAAWARLGCARETHGNCLAVCDDAVAGGIYSDKLLTCARNAASKEALQRDCQGMCQ